MEPFSAFIGVDLGGGKGKNTAVARLVPTPKGVEVTDYGTGKNAPWYDARLIAYLRAQAGSLIAIDAPLALPCCVRCRLSVCPGDAVCDVPTIAWLRARGRTGAPAAENAAERKPRYTPYTQRAAEVVLHEEHGILPRETLGQGMGPLTARAAYLRRALSGEFELDRNLIEVYPKATITQLFSARLAGRYKRSAESPRARLEILNQLPDLTFAPGAWREDGLANDHKFDAVICAYTGYLWAKGGCTQPTEDLKAITREDGWIWFPERASAGSGKGS
jgi:predicted RNase H-like nuclease